MLLTKTVKLKWNYKMSKYYKLKGYSLTNWGDEFEVRIEDLSKCADVLVEVTCDNPSCKGTDSRYWKWGDYKQQVKTDGKTYCKRCAWELYGKDKYMNTKLSKGKSFEQWCMENNRQDVLNRWDYVLNDCNPSEINYSTNKKYWFKCNRGIHISELKVISSFTNGQIGSVMCNQCNSFEQWCLDNNRQDILDRWDYTKNKYKPSEINCGTNKKYWINCPRNLHESECKSINSFTNGQEGSMNCKACNSFAQWGIDNLGEGFLEKYWDYNKNKVNPWEVSYGSNQKVLVKCQEKDYHKSTEITCNDFSNGIRCVYCSHKSGKVHELDSLGTLYPQVEVIWSEKNDKSVYQTTPNSNKRVWWKCQCGKHSDYYRSIDTSNKCDFRCPKCVEEEKDSILQNKVVSYLESLSYNVLHERNCTIIPRNTKSKTNNTLPFDNEIIINNKKLLIEVHGIQHYELCGFHRLSAKHKNTTPEHELYMQQVRDRYKRMYAKSKGYYYLEIPYWTDNVQEEWKQLIEDKIKEINKILGGININE